MIRAHGKDMADDRANSSENQVSLSRTTVSDKLANITFITARRYDLLVNKHTEMYLKKENPNNKIALSSAFVGKTIDDVVAMLNDNELKELLAEYVCDCTERVVSKCSDDGLVSAEALPRLHSFYLYSIYLLPTGWTNVVRNLESICYRDMTRVYDRYLVVKTIMSDLFKNITDTVLNAMFGTQRQTQNNQ